MQQQPYTPPYQYNNTESTPLQPSYFSYPPPSATQPPPQAHAHYTYPSRVVKVLDTEDLFTESEVWGKVVQSANTTYRACYKFCYIVMLMFSFIFIPFVGMSVGFFDALIALFVRPFCRPIGRLFMDLFGKGDEIRLKAQLRQQANGKLV